MGYIIYTYIFHYHGHGLYLLSRQSPFGWHNMILTFHINPMTVNLSRCMFQNRYFRFNSPWRRTWDFCSPVSWSTPLCPALSAELETIVSHCCMNEKTWLSQNKPNTTMNKGLGVDLPVASPECEKPTTSWNYAIQNQKFAISSRYNKVPRIYRLNNYQNLYWQSFPLALHDDNNMSYNYILDRLHFIDWDEYIQPNISQRWPALWWQ